ncbi:unnamed protein product, partial [marine sediment metagenome]
ITKERQPKRDKFKRIVELRVRKALKTITLVGNCAGAAYEYSPADIANIIAALRKTVDQVETRYASKGLQEIEFDLD